MLSPPTVTPTSLLGGDACLLSNCNGAQWAVVPYTRLGIGAQNQKQKQRAGEAAGFCDQTSEQTWHV